VPIILKSGSLKLLKPSGPVQACNGLLYGLFYYPLQKFLIPLNGNTQLLLYCSFGSNRRETGKKLWEITRHFNGAETVSGLKFFKAGDAVYSGTDLGNILEKPVASII
jgi:hypothetical protein